MKRKSESKKSVLHQDSDDILESVMNRISNNQSERKKVNRIPSFDGVVKHIAARQEERVSHLKKTMLPLKLVDSTFGIFLVISGLIFIWKFILPLFTSIFNNPEAAVSQGLNPDIFLMIGIISGIFAAIPLVVFLFSVLKPVKS
ncbi:MAG: hypothetical protein JW737_02680 [Acidobacteria bacterium]|nr:hypothetical protein [Acidobacteriota bacterium]